MNRYVIARVSSPPRASRRSLARAAPAAELVEVGEVDRDAFFRICFHMARSVPRHARPRTATASSPQAARS